MASSRKLQDIDQKIKELQDKKKYLEQKQITDLAKLLKKVEAHILPPEVIAGVLIEAVEAFHNKQDKTQQWAQKGKDFLITDKKNKGGDKAPSPSFRGNEKSPTPTL